MLRIAFLLLVLAGPGCGTFSPEHVDLSPEQIALIVKAVGTNLDDESVRSAVAKEFSVKVDAVETKVDAVTGELQDVRVTLPAIAKEAAEAGGTSALEKVADNPTTSGLIAAGGAAVAAIMGLLARRSRLRREAKQP